ncbi:EAL domain-containing protein [Legionella pneumophila]|nr:EAL domain-containing protein [Legionella pneumophila]
MEQKKISLYAQAVTDGKNCFHKEVFVRIRNQEGEELGAGYFIPVAEKLGLAYLIDQYVLNELTVMDIATHTHFALNIQKIL